MILSFDTPVETEPKGLSLAEFDTARVELTQPEPTVSLAAPAQLSAPEIEELRKEARESLFFFAKGVLGYKDLDPGIHGPICKILEDATIRRLKITLPRSWFKSTLVSIAFPMWCALPRPNLPKDSILGPNIRILIAQNTATNAMKKLAEIDSHFRQNDLFRALFPDLLPKENQTWRVDSKCVPRTLNAPESTFEGVGVKTQIVSRHYDLIIEDDTVAPDFDELGAENVAPTKEDIDLAIGWHRLVPPLFINLDTSRWIVVGTRWFERDLLSWIRDNQPGFYSIDRAVRETDGRPDPEGEIVWNRFNQRVLDELQATMGAYMYSCLYMNLPMSSGEQNFRLEWFEYYEEEESELIVTTTLDPGGDPEDAKGKVDYSAITTTGKSLRTGNIYVLEVSRFKTNPGEMIEKLFGHVQRWKPVKVGIETQAYQRSLLYWIREMKRMRDLNFSVEGITNNRRSKNSRIQGLIPLIQARKLRFRRHQQALVAEFLSFPNGSNDDMIDSLSMHLPLWFMTVGEQEQRQVSEPDPMSLDSAIAEIELRSKQAQGVVNPCFDQVGGLPFDIDDGHDNGEIVFDDVRPRMELV